MQPRARAAQRRYRRDCIGINPSDGAARAWVDLAGRQALQDGAPVNSIHAFSRLGSSQLCAVCGAHEAQHTERTSEWRGMIRSLAQAERMADGVDSERERRIREMARARMDRPAPPKREPGPGVMDPDKCPSEGT